MIGRRGRAGLVVLVTGGVFVALLGIWWATRSPENDSDASAALRPRSLEVLRPGRLPAGGARVMVHRFKGSLVQARSRVKPRADLRAFPAGEPTAEFRADGAGQVRLTGLAPGIYLLHARHEGRVAVGVADLSGEGGEVAPLRLARGREIAVTALGPGGHGVPRVPVSLLPVEAEPYAPWPRTGPGGYASGLGAVPTDEAGQARFFVTARSSPELFVAEQLRVLAVVHGGRWVEARPRIAEGDGAVALLLPPTREIEFVSETPLTVAWCQGDSVNWPTEEVLVSGGGPRLGSEESLLRETGSWSATVGPTPVSVGGFQPGVPMTFRVTKPGHEPRDFTHTLPEGPPSSSLRLIPGPPLPRVRLRIVDASGQPAALPALRATRVEDVQWPVPLDSFALEEPGLYEVAMPPNEEVLLEAAPSARWDFVRSDGSKGFGPRLVPPLETGAVHDLGTFTVKLSRILVAGRVVDASGRGIGGVEVSIRRNRHFDSDPPLGRLVGSVTSDATGAFAFPVKGVPLPFGYTATVGGDFSAAPVTFLPEQRDLVIVAKACGGLVGRIWLADPAFLPRTRLLLHADHFEHPREVLLLDEGWFEAGRLRAGPYALEIRVGRSSRAQVSQVIERFEVPAGEWARPEELRAIDPGRGFVRAEVTVHGPEGRPLEGVRLRWRGVEQDVGFYAVETTNREGKGWTTLRSGLKARLRVFVPRFAARSPSLEGLALRDAFFSDPVYPLTVQLQAHVTLRLFVEEELPELPGLAEGYLILGRFRSEAELARLRARQRGRPREPASYESLQSLRAPSDLKELVFDRAAPGPLGLIYRSARGGETILLSRFFLPAGQGETHLSIMLEPEAVERLRSKSR